MENVYYNTYTISDSDDSVIIDGRPQRYKDLIMSPEEPEFFRQVIQQQKRKRKKSMSPEIAARIEKNPVRRNIRYNEDQNSCILIDNPIPNICESKSVKLYNSNMPKTNNIQTTMNIGTTYETTESKQKKRSTKEEIEERKREKKVRKEAKEKLAEELKRLSPKECMKYITVHIDINLHSQDYSEQILSEIQNTDAKYKIEPNSNVSHSITWSRQISDTVSEDAKFMLLIWDFDYVKTIITSNQLLEKISHLKSYNTQLSIIIYCTADQLKKTKSKKNGQFSKSNNMLNSLEQMMLSCHVSFRFVDNKKDLGLSICYLTKSIAQKPYKLNKYKEEQEGCDWYASGYTKNCVTVDKNGTGLTQLWRQMLSQFPLCALETSEAIASMYKSPIALLEAYDKCNTRLEGETLLQDIPVRRGFGPLASNRRIGPELSKKIYTFFTENTGCTTLSQEQ